MPTPIDDLVLARAEEMAAHDGVSVSTVFIVGAAAQLQAELTMARDRLLNVAAGSAHAGDAASPEPVEPETAPEAIEQQDPAAASPATAKPRSKKA